MERLDNPWHREMCECRTNTPVKHCSECGDAIRETDYYEYDKYDDDKVYCKNCVPVGYCEECGKPLFGFDDYHVDPFDEKKLFCKECVGL